MGFHHTLLYFVSLLSDVFESCEMMIDDIEAPQIILILDWTDFINIQSLLLPSLALV